MATQATTPARAEVDPLVLQEITLAAQLDPEAALLRVEATIAIETNASEPDFRALFDLMAMKADLLEVSGDVEASANALADLARFALEHRDLLGRDPAAILLDAADRYADAGMTETAIATLETALAWQNEDGQSILTRRQMLRRLADLAEAAGQDLQAAAYREQADRLLEAQATSVVDPDGDGIAETVTVYYATDRARSGELTPAKFYSAGRADALEYGTVEVTIPASHDPGVLERPDVFHWEFGEASDRHIVLKSVTPIAEEGYFARMRQHLTETGANDAFVFVHGFNTSFEMAALRTAQLTYDMSFTGLPILYSWPSAGSMFAYLPDSAVVELSGRRLLPFLEDVLARTGATRVHVIAHSMGNRAVTDALELMATARGQKEGDPPVFDQLVFAAPDVDAGLFAEMARTFRPLAQRLTLYASDRDWALKVSQKLHGDAPRAGQGGNQTLVTPVLDSVDMTDLGPDMIAHNYFANDSSAIVDLMALFWRDAPPDRRCGLEPNEADSGARWWTYHPSECDGSAILPLIGRLRHLGIETMSGIRGIIADLIPDRGRADRTEEVIGRLIAPR